MEPSSEHYSTEYIDKFDDFKKHGMGLNKGEFQRHRDQISAVKDKAEPLKQFEEYMRQLYHQLDQSRTKNYLLFFDWMPQVMRQEAVRLVDNEHPQWKWQYEHIFLGNRKQLIVYKNYRPLERYLQRYRMPTSYEQLKRKMQAEFQKLEELVMRRNQLFSLEENTDEVTKRIEEQEQEVSTTKKEFLEMLEKIMEDFKDQKGRQLLNLRHLRVQLRVDVFALIDKMKLSSDTLKEHSRAIWETDIYKEPKLYYLRMQEEADKLAAEGCVREEKQQGRRPPKDPKEDIHKADSDDDEQPSQPNGIKDYIVDSVGYKQVNIRFRIPYNNLRPITKYLAYTTDKGDINFHSQVKNTAEEGEIFFKMTLAGEGLMHYIIKAQNEIGIAQEYDILTVNIPDRPNKKIYMAGSCEGSLIPYIDDRSKTWIEESCIQAIPCSRVSINNAVMAIDSHGSMAMWGLLYETTDFQEETLPNLEESDPNLIAQVKNVTRISCGQNYYLACDAEGRAWGFGLNLRYQLGLGESRATFSPRDPVQIGYFESQKIFVVDVVASIDHSLALDSKGIAYTWGANQIGRSHRDIKDAYGNITNFTLIQGKQLFCQMEPRPISNSTHNINRVEKIRAGNNFCAIVGDRGELFMWGTNRQGQLGCGQLKNNHEIVELILVPIENQYFKSKQLKVIDLSLGSTHCLALVEDNKGKHSMYAWGSAEDGECGKVKQPILYEPTKIDFFEDHKVEVLRASNGTSMVKSDRGLFLFGKESFLRDVKSTRVDNLRRLEFAWISKIRDFQLAGFTAIFLTDM